MPTLPLEALASLSDEIYLIVSPEIEDTQGMLPVLPLNRPLLYYGINLPASKNIKKPQTEVQG